MDNRYVCQGNGYICKGCTLSRILAPLSIRVYCKRKEFAPKEKVLLEVTQFLKGLDVRKRNEEVIKMFPIKTKAEKLQGVPVS